MHLETFPQAAQDRDRVLHRRLFDQHRLEAALQGRVLFDVLPVFIQGGGADAVQFAPGQHRFQHVAGIHRALGLAGPDDGVQFVDEEDDPPFGLLDLVQHRLQAFLELAAILGSGDQRSHIQGKDGLVLQPLRHVAPHDALGQTFDNGGLADPRFADQHRVVLGLAGQYPDHPAHLFIPSDDRIKLVGSGHLDQVAAVFLQRLIGGLGIGALHPLAAAHLGQRLQEAFTVDARQFENPPGRYLFTLRQQRHEQMLDRDVFILEPFGLVLRRHQDA